MAGIRNCFPGEKEVRCTLYTVLAILYRWKVQIIRAGNTTFVAPTAMRCALRCNATEGWFVNLSTVNFSRLWVDLAL